MDAIKLSEVLASPFIQNAKAQIVTMAVITAVVGAVAVAVKIGGDAIISEAARSLIKES